MYPTRYFSNYQSTHQKYDEPPPKSQVYQPYHYNQNYQLRSSSPIQFNPIMPRNARQVPVYYLNTQKYIAVPGRVVQHYNSATLPYTTVPVVRKGFQLVTTTRLLPPYYQYQLDPGSDPNVPEDEQNMNDDMRPPPAPPGSEAEHEPEQPHPPPENNPSPEEDNPPPEEVHNENCDDSGDHQSTAPPGKPPPHPHAKVVHKHISIHVPPDELESDDDQSAVTVIRPKVPGPEKHVNIIFVKAPSSKARKQKTEVILPETPEQKTIVYVLVKRPDPVNDGSIRISGPAPTKPPKPQVYFIRYKQKKENSEYMYAERKKITPSSSLKRTN